jgi:hypothetical protein
MKHGQAKQYTIEIKEFPFYTSPSRRKFLDERKPEKIWH